MTQSIFLLFALFSVQAQAVQVLTIQSAVEEALTRNPSLNQAREKIVQDEETISQDVAALFPNLQATLAADHRKDATNTPFILFGGTPYERYALDIKAVQPVYRYGILSGIELPKKDRVNDSLILEIQTRDLTSNVIQAFYKVILDQRNLDTLLNILSVEKEAVATAQRRYEIGRGKLLDVLQAKTQVAVSDSQIAQAHTLVETDAAQLANDLGDMGSREIKAVGQLEAIPLKSVYSQIESKVAKLPEIEQVAVQEERLVHEKAATLGSDLPQLNASAELTRIGYDSSALVSENATAWNLELSLVIPIFSGLSSIHERRVFASRATQLEKLRENTQNAIILNQLQGQKNLEFAFENIAISQTSYDLAEASMKEARRNFRLATIDFIQYLSVQQAYLQARSAFDQAKYNYVAALTRYFVVTGVPISDLVTMLGGQKS